ncbi:MAG: xanthine dehydrogenase family protein subunit M [Candidatus Limnocylindrales bacterium]
MTTLAPFELHPAGSVAEATALLDEHGDDAVVYCGGTELVLLMKLGFAAYGHLVDVKPIAELSGIDVDKGTLRIGAAVTHRAIERSPLVAEGWPEMVGMERAVANIRVRGVGTLGGNLAFADPHSDPAAFLVAADARVVLGRGDERRRIRLAEFILGPYATDLQPGELVVAIEVPGLPQGAGMAHVRFAFHERPAVTVSTLVRVADGLIAEARVAVGSVGVMAARATAAEEMLVGLDAGRLEAAALAEATEAAAEASEPVTDANGSAEYKRHLVGVLVGRAVRAAIANACGT